jgi:hypothetical protein
MTPYLIGLHMTIDSWRDNRDAEGWWVKPRGEPLLMSKNQEQRREGPKKVKAVPRLPEDLETLATLLGSSEPKMQRVRCRWHGQEFYGFGDASESSFGASFQVDGVIDAKYGQWCNEATEVESSNWREATNLIEHAERVVEEHDLGEMELFLFTDNSTAEAAFWKGHSKSRKLFEIVLRFRKLEMKYDLLLHAIHISRRWMIWQGSDGLSRADKATGPCRGE